MEKSANNEEMWQAVLAEIQLSISRVNFLAWFKETRIISIDDGTAVISVPNNFAKEWLENKYNKTILKVLRNLSGDIKKIECVIKPSVSNNKEPFVKRTQPSPEAPQEGQLDFKEYKINKETGLNPKYKFDNFIVGPFNELANAAAHSISENPGFTYNPFFIYGGVGLGKTHLLQAVGNKIIKNFPEKKIKYIPSERFISQVIASIHNHDMETFKQKYREIDVLIIDDIQFLAGKEKTQEEFFHFFNVLYENNKQIIISSDRPPKAIPALEERLRSRFEGGMIADISLPDFETRVAVLKIKSQEKNIELSNEALSYIATNIQKNIRELEGALNRLIAHAKIGNQISDLNKIKETLKTIISNPQKNTTPKKILQAVAEFYDLTEKDLLNSSRRKEIVTPRQIAMYLLREELKGSFPFIGRKLGNRDHTTAIHSCSKISKEIKENEKLSEEIALIRQRIYSV